MTIVFFFAIIPFAKICKKERKKNAMKNLKFAAAGIAVCAGILFTACSSAETVDFVHSSATADGKFTCELFGIGANFDTEIWTLATDSEIAAANGASSASNEDLKAAIKTNGAVQDMAAAQESGVNVMLLVEDANVTKLGNISEEGYLNASKDMLEAQFAGMMDNVSSEVKTVTVAGTSHPTLDVSGEAYGVPVYGRYICIKNGNLMGIIAINAFEMDEINEITGLFYSL